MTKVKSFLKRMREWWRTHGQPIWRRFQIGRWLVTTFLAVFFVVSALGTFEAKTTDVKDLKARLQTSTEVYDVSGAKAGAIAGQKGTYVDFGQMSGNLIDAVLSTEDRNFYHEPGFSITGMARGAVVTVLNRLRGSSASAGGSTITQQLVKNAFLTQEQSITRKVREIFLAVQVEKTYSKNEILAMYLNNAYFGHGVWGVQDAAKKYFDTDAKDLSVQQAAMLAGMLQSPNGYNPLDYPDNALARRNQVLINMVNNKKLSEADERTLAATPVGASDNQIDNSSYNFPYFFDAVIDEAISKYDLTESEIMNDGYKIYTTLDQTDQTNLQDDYDNDYLNPIGGDSQAATILLDAKTGGVKAIVGGRGDHVFRGFNRATQMRRQPGSSIKPIVDYAPSLSRGYSYDSLLKNTNSTFGTNGYAPHNYNNVETEPIAMYKAIENSYNIPAVWLLDQMGVSVGYNAGIKAGLPLTAKDKNLALAIGGLDKGVSPLQMAQAYTSFANGGLMTEAHFITKIEDASGKVVANADPKQTRLWSKKVADEMTSMMLGVYTDGTGVADRPAGYTIAGKTGTTEATGVDSLTAATDSWAIAYTPDIVAATWMGYDSTSNGESIPAFQSTTAGPLMKSFLKSAIDNSAKTAFTVQNIETVVANQTAISTGDGNSSGSSSTSDITDAIASGAQKAWSYVEQGAESAWSNLRGLLGN
jgi:penicillin-binding protein 2A